jgi:hypothetical protein
VALRGVKQLQARLTAVGRPHGRDIARQWAQETVTLARQNVRRRTGATARSIGVQKVNDRGATVVAGGASKWIESGTPPQRIESKRGKPLRFEKAGRTIFAKRVLRPKIRARPFFRKAARKVHKEQKALARIADAWNKAA